MRRWTWRIILASMLLCCGASAHAMPLTIAVDLRQLQQQDFSRFQLLQLHRKLLVRLTEAGFAVVGAQLTSRLRVLLKIQQETLYIQIKGAQFVRKRQVTHGKETLTQFHLEAIHKLIGAARQLRWKILQQEARKRKQHRAKKNSLIRSRKTPPGRPHPRTTPRKLSLPKKPARWGFSLDVLAAALYRIQAADLLVRVGLRWGLPQGLGLYLSAMFSPSTATDLTVLEWGAQIGPMWRQPLTSTFALETGLLLGFSHHYYLMNNVGSDPSQHWDFVGTLLLAAHWQPLRFFGLRPWFGAGLASQGRHHRTNGLIVWERSLIRFEFGLALHFSLSR